MLDNYATTGTDSRGDRWHFAYTGGSSIKIRRHNGTSDPTRGTEWTHQIALDYYAMTPERVTGRWIDARAASWIAGRNGDIASGLYDGPYDYA